MAAFARLSAWLTLSRALPSTPMARYSILSTWPREALEFINALEGAARALRTARRGLSGAYGLTVAEWRMLRALRSPRKSTAASASARMRQERSVAELARRLRISRQAAHRTAARLARAGLLRCVPRGGDRRLRLASLTPDGERSLEHLESTMRTLLLEVTNDISPHRLEPLTDALTRLSDRLRSCPSVCRASLRGRGRAAVHAKPVNQVDDFSQGSTGAGQRGRCARRARLPGRVPLLGRRLKRASHDRDVRVRWPRAESATRARQAQKNPLRSAI